MADDDALFQKGMPIRREVLGPEYVDASMARADEFMIRSSGRRPPGHGAGRGGTEPSTERPGA